jgi:hypothetical protein
MFLRQTAGEFCKTIPITVTVEGWSEKISKPTISMRGRTAHTVQQTDIHGAAQKQAKEMEIGEIGGVDQDR